MVEVRCPDCHVERADYEGPNGAWLPTCPNCGSAADPQAIRPGDLLARVHEPGDGWPLPPIEGVTTHMPHAASSLRSVDATWSDETPRLICLYVYAPGRRKQAPVARTKQVKADVMIDYDEAGAVLGVEVIADAG